MSAPTLSAALLTPPLPAALPSGTAPTPASPSGPGAFAQELRQAQAGPAADSRPANPGPAGDKAREADADAAAETSDAPATDGADKAPHRLAARNLREGWNGLVRGARDTRDDAASDTTVAAELGEASARSGNTKAAPDAQPADPAAAFIATLLPRPQPTAMTPAAGKSIEGAADGATDAAPCATAIDITRAARPDTGTAVDTDAAPAAHLPSAGADRQALAAQRLHAQADDRQPETQRLAAAAEPPSAQAAAREPAAAVPAATPALPTFAAELARASQATSTQPAAATPAPAAPSEVRLATPVPSPDFVPRFSAEVAVLARDGVQEARVQVNPVELGPISVQITLDGQAAQVHLAVASDQTRQVLEQAMPSLAAALRESGLTLTGGGVFQQARQNGRESGPDGGRSGASRSGGGNRDEGATPAVAAPARRVRLPGAVDLYA